jgi:predicted peptidase
MQPSTASGSLTLAHEILQETLAEYASVVDTRRVYITGISMGGYGTWDAIERWPQDFAAAAPISGAGDPSQVSTVARLPVWAFHGTLDTTVPVAGSRDMIAALTAAGGHPLYTEYPNAKHDIWVRVYSDPTFLAWLFAQHRPWF